ncbi:MAG: hypothetical protein J6K39_02560 [Clostridia bacterium]|nr:hypothetical protein [Clostridia bacterium]
MINVIVPVTEKPEEFKEFIEQNKGKNVRFFVGIRESLKDKITSRSKAVEIHTFKNSSKKEEIINSLHSCKFEKGKIMIVRRPLTKEEFGKLASSSKEIATLSAKHGKFVSAIKKFTQKIIQRVFAFSFFDDISAICYGESMFELLSVCANLSMASRVNKYVGVEIEEIETIEKQVKKQYSRWTAALKLIFWCLIFAGSVVGGVFVCIYSPLYALIVISVIAWIAVALVFLLGGILGFTRTVAVGDLRYGRAEEV